MTMTSQTQSFPLEAQVWPVTVTLNFDEDSNWKIGGKNINNGESGRPLLLSLSLKPKQLRVVRDDNGNDDDDNDSGDDNHDDSGSNDDDIRLPCQGG